MSNNLIFEFKKNIVFFFLIIFIPIFLKAEIAEEILSKMSLDEKIGQLFMIPACPKRDMDHFNDLEKVFNDYHIGGVIIKQSDAKSQIDFLNKLQKISKYPLIVAADAEWGLAMRMENTIAFPKNMTLGAIQDDALLYEMGKEIGKELRAVGVHINLAPVVDINSNLTKPIINVRSFSDDRYIVTQKAKYLMKGMEYENIIACIKHFPGYGDITIDPHKDLPIAYHDLKRLDEIEFYPYDFLINDGVEAIMTGHIILPKISDKPATMSKEILDILINGKNYKHLIITDALNMSALTNHYSFEDIALYAHIAGHDILLYGDHIAPNIDDILQNQVPRAFNKIKKAYLEKRLPDDKLDAHVLKILKAKEKLKLFENRFVSDYDPNIILNPKAFALKKKLFENSLTIVKKSKNYTVQFLPIDLNKSILYLSTKPKISNDLIANRFLDKFKSFNIDEFNDFIEKDLTCLDLLTSNPLNISSYDTILIGIYESDMTENLINKIKKFSSKNVVIFFF
jgi:beta-glucosidase-like glycosyl hydrolase